MMVPMLVCVTALVAAPLQEGPVEETGRLLAPKKVEVDGATAWSFLLDEKPPEYTILGSYVASPDVSLLTVLKGRVIQQIAIPEFKELRVLDLKRPTGGLWASKEGLALHTSSPADPAKNHEIWLIDPATLAIKSRSPIPPCRPKTSAGLSTALYPKDSTRIVIADLKTGKTLKEYSLEELLKNAGSKIKSAKRVYQLGMVTPENFPVPTPDGKYLLCADGPVLHRIRINGAGLQYEEISLPLRQPQVVRVSTDSKLIMIWNPAESPMPPNAPPAGTMIFKVEDLQKPVAVLPDVRPLGIDPAAGKYYGIVPDKAIVVFNTAGKKEKEYAIPVPANHSGCFVHVEGSKMLVLPLEVAKPLLWIELPR